MFGRGALFVTVLLAAVAIPFFLVGEEETGGGWARLRDSLFPPQRRAPGYTSPVPSTSPLPPRRNLAQPLSPQRTGRPPIFSTPRVTATFPMGPASPSAPGLPPGATATPWMPIDGSAPATSAVQSGAYAGVQFGGTRVAPGSAGVTPGSASSQIGPPLRNVGDLFRFDITPDWVVHNWPRVSSQLAEFSYTGLRVPVVSGTGIQDLAGSMTYSFDSQQVLQRMAFVGTTGDPRQLIQLATARFKMQQEAALNGTCFVKRGKNDIVTDMLRIKHVALATGLRPHQRYKVAMELNRPENGHGLSAINARMLEHERKIIETGRATPPTP